MTNLFMSYDNSGFEEAKKLGTDKHFNNSHTLTEQLEQLIVMGNHDLFKCFCSSYEIYDESGALVFRNSLKDAA